MFDDMQKDFITGEYTDFLGRPLSRKEVKKRTLVRNKRKGEIAEENVRLNLELQGYDVERTPKGKDFVARRKSILTGATIQTKHIEVKSGNAKLSKLQKKQKAKKSNYQLIRLDSLGI